MGVLCDVLKKKKSVANPGLFGDDEEPSQKIAGHELKSLTAFFNVNQIHKIGFAMPMIALLDVLGHRLIALALCPLNSKTLVHGEMVRERKKFF